MEYRYIKNDRGEWVPYTIFAPGRHYPFLEPLFDDVMEALVYHRALRQVVVKPTQVGLTEYAISLLLFFVDKLRSNALYTLPVQSQLGDFAHMRIDEVIQHSPYLAALFTDISNVGLKKARTGGIYLRGSNSEAQLEELSARLLIRDELDRQNQDNAELARKRLTGQVNPWQVDMSHPTVRGKGIWKEYENSSMGVWVFSCPHCNEEQPFVWADERGVLVNVSEDLTAFRCAACGRALAKEALLSGRYRDTDVGNPVRGYQFPAMLSPVGHLEMFAREWVLAQGNPLLLQLFYNTALGLPYSAGGMKRSKEQIEARMKGNPAMANEDPGPTTMGIDVGGTLHYWIQRGDLVVRVGMVGSWSELDYFARMFNVKCAVIDADPEFHKAREIRDHFRDGLGIDAWVCEREGGGKPDRWELSHDERILRVNMTWQFDEFFAGLSAVRLPIDLPEEAISHLLAPERVEVRTQTGVRGGYNKGVCHWADAGCYAMEGQKLLRVSGRLTDGVSITSMTKQSRWKLGS